MPVLGETRSPVTREMFSRVQPSAGLDVRACDQLLTRYVRARILSRTVFGRAYYGWQARYLAAARAAELGAISAQLRVDYLATDRGLARLLAAYAITPEV